MIQAKHISILSRSFWTIHNLYMTAFPPIERFPFSYLYRKSFSKDIDFYVLHDDSTLIGLLYITKSGETSIVFYFAIIEELRNNNYGSRALEWLQTHSKTKNIALLLEWQDPTADNYEIRKRRKAFYLRNGFKETGFIHNSLDKTAHYEIISTTGTFNQSEYLKAVEVLYPPNFSAEIKPM